MPVITGNKFTTKNAVSIVVVIIPVISECKDKNVKNENTRFS